MRKLLGTIALSLCVAGVAGADIDYEGAGSGKVPDGYAGMNWSADHYSLVSGSGGYGDMGTQVGFNAFAATPISFWSDDSSKFDIGEVRASTAWRDWVDMEFRGLNNGSVVHSVVLRLDRPTVHTLNFTDIDEMQIHYVADSGSNFYTGGDGNHIVLDDWTLDAGPPRYSMSVSGRCPGTVTVSWANADAGVQQGLVIGNNLGSTTIPPGPCSGTVLGISGAVQLVDPPGLFGTGSGSGSISGNAGSGACGKYLQLVQGSDCATTNVVQIP